MDPYVVVVDYGTPYCFFAILTVLLFCREWINRRRDPTPGAKMNVLRADDLPMRVMDYLLDIGEAVAIFSA